MVSDISLHSNEEFRKTLHVLEFVHLCVFYATLAFATAAIAYFRHHRSHVAVLIDECKCLAAHVVDDVANLIGKRARHEADALEIECYLVGIVVNAFAQLRSSGTCYRCLVT